MAILHQHGQHGTCLKGQLASADGAEQPHSRSMALRINPSNQSICFRSNIINTKIRQMMANALFQPSEFLNLLKLQTREKHEEVFAGKTSPLASFKKLCILHCRFLAEGSTLQSQKALASLEVRAYLKVKAPFEHSLLKQAILKLLGLTACV